MTTTYDVADMFLSALGAPHTPSMQRAVAIWLRWESGGTVTGNNPWNLHSGADCPASKGYCPGNGSLPGQIGNRYAGSGDRNVAVFATLQDGVNANAANLRRVHGAGYESVISQAQAGNAVGFLTALQSSSWSAGHYSYSKLVNTFTGHTEQNTPLTIKPVGGSTTGDTTPAPTVVSLATLLHLDPNATLNLGNSKDIIGAITALDGTTLTHAETTRLLNYIGGNLVAQSHGMASPKLGDIMVDTTTGGAPGLELPDPLSGVPKAIADFGDALTKIAGFMAGLVLIALGIFIYTRSARQNVAMVGEPGAVPV